ncbi:MAG TPA: PP2C family protein-serine/threonine phosphatase [Acidimicrobiales bacterium]|nr:PP2C family protein-serine/threonine phosphatase [Acidimicrobiales bacterium]
MDLAAVLRAAQTTDPASVVTLVGAAARDIGASDVVAYVVDFEQRVLEPIPDHSAHADVPHVEEVTTTMAGRAFLTRAPVTVERPDGTRVWVPIVEGSDRTGVLAMTLPQVDDRLLGSCADLGLLAGYLIAAHTRCTDYFQLHRRRKAMSLAASMQWDLLPPLVLRTPACDLVARLEPAYDVGGDSFDYALNGNVLDVALIDAMGHGVTASSIASLVIGSYRHGRREARTLASISATLDEVLDRQHAGEAFSTGWLGQLEVETGALTWTSAGHPCPLVIRNGQVVKELEGPVNLPWGLGGVRVDPAQEFLEPGDAVLVYTDGVIEARTADGDEFGIDRLADVAGQCASNQLVPEEFVRKLVETVLDHQYAELRDDATVLLFEWHGSAS